MQGAAPAAGTVLAGKFAVERVLGSGGSGVVVAAQHLLLDRRVAIKLLHQEVATSSAVVTRFLREAQLAARLTSPHVVRILDADRLDTGQPFIVMEYLEGNDLRVLAKQSGKLAPALTARYCAEACEGLAEAHAAGIIHRDVKPSNLFAARRAGGGSLVKLVDFGISKASGGSDGERAAPESLTRSHHVFGSLHFMSPEQARSSRNVDERTDVWSMGVTLFVLVTGRYPFEGHSLVEIAAAIRSGISPDLGADVPAEYARIVHRCLRPEPPERWSASELGASLREFCARSSELPTVALPPRTETSAGERRAQRWLLPAVLTVTGGVGLAAVWTATRAPAASVAPPAASVSTAAMSTPVTTNRVTAAAPAPAPTTVPSAQPVTTTVAQRARRQSVKRTVGATPAVSTRPENPIEPPPTDFELIHDLPH